MTRRARSVDGGGRAVVFLTQARTKFGDFLDHVRAKYVISAKESAFPPSPAAHQRWLGEDTSVGRRAKFQTVHHVRLGDRAARLFET